ncbi:MAG: fibronectin type III domain-containing protein [Candidatus Micrarchaeota archaeon]
MKTFSGRAAAVFLLLLIAKFGAVAPLITNPQALNIGTGSARIHWSTDPQSDSKVNYGTSEPLDLSNSSNDNATEHSIHISGLSSGTTYYFNVSSCIGGDCGSAGPFNFTTASLPPANPAPAIIDSSIIANATCDSVRISWTTDIPSDSNVFLGVSLPYDKTNHTDLNTTSHSIWFYGLVPSSNYHFLVQSCNMGNCTNSTDKAFSTQSSVQPSPSPTQTPSPSPSPSENGGVQPPSTICIDSDEGKDYYIKGFIIAGNEGGDDACESDTVLKEYLCNDERTLGGAIRYACPNGCNDGRCLLPEEIALNASPSPGSQNEPGEIELKVGFTTKLHVKYEGSSTLITYEQELDGKFSGEIHVILPFEITEYNRGGIVLFPKPILVKNDGNGRTEAIWEEDIDGPKFTLQITATRKVDRETLESFSAAMLLSSIIAPDPDLIETISERNERNAITANDTIGGMTGLATASQSSGSDFGWLTPLTQLVLLIIGIGAIHYFEKDIEPSAGETSGLLEEMENEWK